MIGTSKLFGVENQKRHHFKKTKVLLSEIKEQLAHVLVIET